MYQKKYSNSAEATAAAPKKHVTKGTIAFYIVYILLILAFVIGIAVAMSALQDWLVRFEASQPAYKCQEVFGELFEDPNWEKIYELSGTEDTDFEGKAAYAAYMTQKIGDQKLTYLETSAGLSGGKKYIVKLGDEKVATFTLTSTENSDTGIDDWALDNVEIFFSRTQSVTVEKLPEHTVLINGVALDDSYTIRTIETVAENYLPEGAHGYRLVQQQITGLLTEPEVTVTDADGNPVPVAKDPETDVYCLPKVEMQASEAEKQLALNAIQAYAKYMIRAEGIDAVTACFDTSSDIYEVIRKYEAWTMQSYASYEFTDAAFSEYYRYSDSLFSIRAQLDLNVKRYNGSIKTYELNSTLFLQKNEAGNWLAIDMTNADVQEIVERVRLTFMDGDTLLTTSLVESDTLQLTLPTVTPPDGKMLEGWVLQHDDGSGKITLTVVFHPSESGIINLPVGGKLTPMTLYAHYTEVDE